MPGVVEANLQKLGITLPVPAAPAASYAPFCIVGNMVYVSGQLPKDADGKLMVGQLGDSLTAEDGKAAAKSCAVQLIAQIRAAAGGDLDKVKRVVMVRCYVNSACNFHDHPLVANGCSDLLVSVFGAEVGLHARCAFGVAQLPFNSMVEIEAQFELKDDAKAAS
ncbi:putative endoribonuclease L-PSP (pb5) [Leishmania major strain Friedlin]|uniref:Putative endoribonuclease L-PSP (Pb5) n=1 Tax=Leishmania major TaxID=5664 RepID=Q4QBF5_LEIMA|nr:putative endoribonuclease L-PSP (pb5) [Leishmania major strain Friedlin]CAG9574106.1 endoribonuclease_L-PSP_(pb5)_-_putative [Leishmania major strain Friedlin]CAJ03945.1 putative endoribonuclease L-PSP (pb5) [Leishmania major strain Friedlin]|eukprot:XP_001683343.1 putative endoribonuclease L-PSP (pb5) [Leishmania major strain Friedlin]